MQFFTALGLDVKILVAQFINFALLLFILYKIGYKPILKFMEQRTKKIEAGIENAANAEKAYTEAKEKQTAVIVEARKEAQTILAEANDVAKGQRAEAVEKTRTEVKKMLEQAQNDIENDRKKMLREVKGEVVEMVMASTRQILDGAIDQKVDKKWLETQLAKVKK